MAELIIKANYKDLAMFIGGLICVRSPKISRDALNQEASNLAKVIYFQYIDFLVRVPEASLRTSLRRARQILSTAKKLSQLTAPLSLLEKLDYSIRPPNLLLPGDWDRIDRAIKDLEEGAKRVLTAKRPLGRDKDQQKRLLVETVIQTFEIATGTDLATVKKSRPAPLRRQMTALFKLLKLGTGGFDQFHSEDAAKKFIQRYIDDNRPDRDFIGEVMANREADDRSQK